MENDSVKERLERENRCWCELIPILAIRIRCICYHEILSENEIVSASGYLEILDNFVDVQRAHWLHIMCLFNANKQPHHSTSITAWTERNKIGQRFHTLYSLYLSAHDFHWLHSLEGATHHIAYSTVDSFEKKKPQTTHSNAHCKCAAPLKLPEYSFNMWAIRDSKRNIHESTFRSISYCL